jgi:hypothetical protein
MPEKNPATILIGPAVKALANALVDYWELLPEDQRDVSSQAYWKKHLKVGFGQTIDSKLQALANSAFNQGATTVHGIVDDVKRLLGI